MTDEAARAGVQNSDAEASAALPFKRGEVLAQSAERVVAAQAFWRERLRAQPTAPAAITSAACRLVCIIVLCPKTSPCARSQ